MGLTFDFLVRFFGVLPELVLLLLPEGLARFLGVLPVCFLAGDGVRDECPELTDIRPPLEDGLTTVLLVRGVRGGSGGEGGVRRGLFSGVDGGDPLGDVLKLLLDDPERLDDLDEDLDVEDPEERDDLEDLDDPEELDELEAVEALDLDLDVELDLAGG